ncbi:hypothetical protein SNE40_020468 [Patella caerulea]|uniref:Uncharacterized protein n=1 Tax=Patella caerulea TaxID=87958 RepID=A0AAN8GAZ2_PATCE
MLTKSSSEHNSMGFKHLRYTSSKLIHLSNNIATSDNIRIYKEIKSVSKCILKHKPTRRKKSSKRNLVDSLPHLDQSNSCNENLIQILTSNNISPINEKTRVCLLNCRSVNNKTTVLNDFICDENLDICALTETWLNSKSSGVTLSALIPNGYSIKHKNRSIGTGGGVALSAQSKSY